MYPHGNRSGQRKPNKYKHQTSTLITATISFHLRKSVSNDVMLQIQLKPTEQKNMGCKAGRYNKNIPSIYFFFHSVGVFQFQQ